MSLTDLQYRNGGGWAAMPSWAMSLISLGSAIAAPQDPSYRFVVGLAVPIRAYAAALIATGLVIGRAKIPFDGIDETEYLDYLKTIEPGRPLIYRSGEDCYHGEFIGIEQREEEGPSINLIWKRGKQRCKCGLPLKEARKRLQIVGGSKKDSPEKAVGEHRIVHNKEFLKTMLGANNSYEFAMRSRLECIIIGCVNILRHEIKETEISFGPRHIEGTFQDILRARKFLSEGSAYRSNVMPADREQASLMANQETPYMVIFDGSISFLKWRDYWRRSNWLVLLDKTESCFQEAADQLNNEYVENRVSDTSIENALELPQGIDVLSFQEESE